MANLFFYILGKWIFLINIIEKTGDEINRPGVNKIFAR